MENATKLALAKSFTESQAKEVRELVQAGKYEVDAVVKIHGTLTVCEDHEAENPQKLCPWTLALIALNHLNRETRESIISEAFAAIKEHREIEGMDELKANTKRLAAKLLGSTKEMRKGVAKFNGCVEVLEEVQA